MTLTNQNYSMVKLRARRNTEHSGNTQLPIVDGTWQCIAFRNTTILYRSLVETASLNRLNNEQSFSPHAIFMFE
jgi:hypothetical protein